MVPNAGRIDNPVGGFSFALPAGWVESDATHLDYGSALLSKIAGAPSPGQPPPVANDTRVVLGKLDQKLYASAEADNAKAATRLASDMGEFFMPYPGTRVNQETTALGANGVTGGASYYEVKFSDASKPNGQIWAGVVSPSGPNVPAAAANQRWFVVWLGTATTRWTRPEPRRWLSRSDRWRRLPFLLRSAAPCPRCARSGPRSRAPVPAPAPGAPVPHPPRERRFPHPPRELAPTRPHRQHRRHPDSPPAANGCGAGSGSGVDLVQRLGEEIPQ